MGNMGKPMFSSAANPEYGFIFMLPLTISFFEGKSENMHGSYSGPQSYDTCVAISKNLETTPHVWSSTFYTTKYRESIESKCE